MANFWAERFWASGFWASGFWAGAPLGVSAPDFEHVVLFHCPELHIMPHAGESTLMLHGASPAIVHNGVSRVMIAETS